MFLTLYFMPLADFVMGFLGFRSGGAASAGTLECGRETLDCPGTANRGMDDGEWATCECADRSKIFTVSCHVVRGEWEDWGAFNKGECVSKLACSTNGATQDCSSAIANCSRTCKNNIWGSCVCTSCKNGYVMVSGTCYASCNISNGTGYEVDISESSSTTGV